MLFARAGVRFLCKLMDTNEGMNTEYYCPKCKTYFSEDKLPNINKIHKVCGEVARIVRHISEKKEAASDEL
jgi:hypothetical protein